MRTSELYNQVAQLGFEKTLEDSDRFIFAANKAILRVGEIRPAISSCKIHHKPLENLVKQKTFEPIEQTGNLMFEADSAKSFYFEANGKGTCYLEKFDTAAEEWRTIGEVELDSTKNFVPYKGFIKDGLDFVDGNVRLHFAGEFLYYVKNVALYDRIYSDDVSDIPVFEHYSHYDISKIVDDFLSLEIPLIVEKDNVEFKGDYSVENGRIILIPRELAGSYKVLYKRLPKKIPLDANVTEDETPIDLDEDLCNLLPDLIAAYMLADDEPSLANWYMSIYNQRAYELEKMHHEKSPVKMVNAYGW